MWYCGYSLDSVAATQGRRNLHTSGTVILQYDHTIKEEEKYGMKKQKLRMDELQMKWCVQSWQVDIDCHQHVHLWFQPATVGTLNA